MRSLFRTSFSHIFTVIFILMVGTACTSAQQNSADVNWLIEVLELEEGSVVADIGAGDGNQTLPIARRIGAGGKIYSTELGSEALDELRKAVESSELDNITVLESDPAQTNLPVMCCDVIYMRRVYHHIEDPASMNASLFESLKPGGRLGIIDFRPREEEGEPGNRASGDRHGVLPDTVIDELQAAGFELTNPAEQRGRYYYLVMRKPD